MPLFPCSVYFRKPVVPWILDYRMVNDGASPQIDGISSPDGEPVNEASAVDTSAPAVPHPSVPSSPPYVSSPSEKRLGRFAMIGIGLLALLYVIPAFAAFTLFPRADGNFMQFKTYVTVFFLVGAGLWSIGGMLIILRIFTVKSTLRLKLGALLRVLAVVIPLVLVSVGVLLQMQKEPTLYLDIVSPTDANELIAPLSVTFGMESAFRYFKQVGMVPDQFKWNFSGGGTSVSQETFDSQLTFLIPRAGVYNVAVEVSMKDGRMKNVYGRLAITRGSFIVQPTIPLVDEPVMFSLANLFPDSPDPAAPKLVKAKWDFLGRGVSDLETENLIVSYTYHKLGPVTPAVTVTLANQTQSVIQRTIHIEKPPEQPFPITMETEPSSLLGSPKFGVIFMVKTNEPMANVTWDFGNRKTGDGVRVAQVYGEVGTYTVTVEARSQSGAVAKLSKVVRVTNPLDIRDLAFEGSPEVRDFSIEGEVPLTVDLTPVTSQPLITFSWEAPKAYDVVMTDKNLHAVYRDEGKFLIDVIGVDPEQNVFRRKIRVDARAPSTVVTFVMDPPTPTAPALVTFDASDTFVPSGEEITGFEWDFGDSASGDQNSNFSGSRTEHLYQNPGTYTIGLKVRTTSGKIFDGKQALVVRAPLIDACFIPSRRTGKAPLGVHFDTRCSTGTFSSWLWDFGDGAQSDVFDPTHVFEKEGDYTVTATATTKDGRKSSKSTTISVSPL
ncbi:MAG: PKD domain-containing protein [Candidatus Peribacteraceae bacterium]|nr:PKD domain-containing protein [Candidatus Peribacteraceae bacterium]